MTNIPVKFEILLMVEKTLEKQQLNFSRSELLNMKTIANLKYFVTDCLRKPFTGSKSPQIRLDLVSWPISVTLMSFTLF